MFQELVIGGETPEPSRAGCGKYVAAESGGPSLVGALGLFHHHPTCVLL